MGSYWKSDLGVKDALEFGERYPALQFSLDLPARTAKAEGVLQVLPGVAYTIALIAPRGYPDDVPALICLPEEIPKTTDRHNSGDSACLCARCDYRKYWPRGATLAAFVDSLVLPYLTCQHYFDVHGHWPNTGERSHYAPGIWEAYREFCKPLGQEMPNNDTILRVITILSRPGLPGSHNPCPCGNGKPIRRCHHNELQKMRELISPKDAAADLAEIIKDRNQS